MADADSDDQIPGLIEYITNYGVTDSVVNRKAYRMAWIAGRVMTNEFGFQVAMKMVWSRDLNRWMATVAKYLPGDVYVPLMIVYQEEFGNEMQLACGPHEHDCRDYMDVTPKEEKTKPEVAEVNSDFLPLVESLYGDPAIPTAEEIARLSDLYIHEQREEGERGGEG